MRVLDLFCGQGGAGAGYWRAGCKVVGVDIKPQPRYPFGFVCADALDVLSSVNLAEFDLIHASPPCQRYSIAVNNANRGNYPDLVAPVRDALKRAGKPYVIENVPGAPLQNPIELCGCMFGLGVQHNGIWFGLYRPRLFEASWPVDQPEHKPHDATAIPVYGHNSPGWFYRKHGFGAPSAARSAAMGTPWMTRNGTSEAIPPAFTEYLARSFDD
jgi:DNA (cytosine-5)-methyltransferase 1